MAESFFSSEFLHFTGRPVILFARFFDTLGHAHPDVIEVFNVAAVQLWL